MMKRFLFISLVLFLFSSCSEKEGNFKLSGTIDGLKKGKLYLQKMEDTVVVNLDSVEISGDSNYLLQTDLKEPQVLFLYLDKLAGQNNDDIIDFFAEEGDMTINTSLENFNADAKITGSLNQKKWEEYKKVAQKFQYENLDLVVEEFEAQKSDNQEEMLNINKKYNNILRRKYLYTVNFAVSNKDKEIAPYIMLTEAFDAHPKLVDTVYNSLERDIQKSMYGKKLKKHLKEIED